MEQKLTFYLDDRPPLWISVLSAVQWFVMTLASSLVVPVIIGQAFGLSAMETGEFVRRTFLFVGLASFLQVMIGHRLPIIEGPAGMWWGIFLILLNLAPVLHKTSTEMGQNLEMGLMITGIVFFILGVTGVISKIQKLFTPMITGTYMILLTVSMSGSLIKGMLGIGFQGDEVQWQVALISILLVSFILYLSKSRILLLRSFSILIGIAVGWIVYAIFGMASQPVSVTNSFFTIPTLFAFGKPVFDLGITLISLLTGFILLSNLITSISVTGAVCEIPVEEKHFNRGGIITGIAHILSGVGAIVGLVPLAIAAGLIKMTGNASRIPFILSTVIMMVIGFIPSVGLFFAALPSPVGYAVLFTAFGQLLGFGLKDYEQIPFNQRNLTIIGLTMIIGIGVMFIPKETLAHLHPVFSYLLGNGLILGVIVNMILEHLIPNADCQ
ncbi:purine/pyrimidine permease [Tepidibacillus sp. LV47]|uniref:purine/pyrimidine permease n=1 Tax=Tepidibacillus sp. LV47 TaxID=3398228 RepID=UPI003AADF928